MNYSQTVNIISGQIIKTVKDQQLGAKISIGTYLSNRCLMSPVKFYLRELAVKSSILSEHGPAHFKNY